MRVAIEIEDFLAFIGCLFFLIVTISKILCIFAEPIGRIGPIGYNEF